MENLAEQYNSEQSDDIDEYSTDIDASTRKRNLGLFCAATGLVTRLVGSEEGSEFFTQVGEAEMYLGIAAYAFYVVKAAYIDHKKRSLVKRLAATE